ncbi:condensation domain-containing protein [Fictibacillus phosphorivorans]|uniref:condensation domain-containing protein n=1 Tax=Fictibacillus phosphorivorans TaxID=1221500 RepID=UPI003CE75B02
MQPINLLKGECIAPPQDLVNNVLNNQIHCVIKFNNRINERTLEKAIKISLDIVPILVSNIVERAGKGLWQKNIYEISEVFSLVITNKLDDEIMHFLRKPLNSSSDPMLFIRLFRGDHDTICVKINHACTDGGGLKHYVHLLSSIYTALISKESINFPKLDGERGQKQVFNALSISNPLTAWDKSSSEVQQKWAFPSVPGEDYSVNYMIEQILPTQLQLLKVFAGNLGVTINDLLLSAYFRSLFKMLTPQENELFPIGVTVDLRRYLPKKKAEAICNLSSSVSIQITCNNNEFIEETLLKVFQETRKAKENNPGLNGAIVFEMLGGMGIPKLHSHFQKTNKISKELRKYNPTLSNFGQVSKEPILFGTTPAASIYIISPVMSSPSFMLGASTYQDILTLTVGFYESTTLSSDVSYFLDLFKSELLSFIN